VFGLGLDLFNLRREVYEHDSRTPEMEFGTAEEDVFRRDATVNALLYNLDTLQVVDLTGRGLDDMDAKIMRTPLEPRQTFLDGPLRVLRLVRIGSRLGYSIDEQAMASMKDEEIHVALDTKVKRERIGFEVFKMMKGSDPRCAFHLLFEANLYTTVFLGRESSIYSTLQAQLPTPEAASPGQLLGRMHTVFFDI
jgi:tRNA nucleotidyltransferase (CCA-adding enzyme)